MLGLGSSIGKHPVTGKSIVRDGLVLQHNYNLSSVEPLSSGAASFNGTSDYIAINAKPVDTADGTYCWWSNSTQTQFQTIFSHGSSKIGGFHLTFDTTDKPLLYLHSDLYQYWDDTGFADDGKWHHWALVVDVDDMTACKLYCDGVEVARSAASTSGTVTSYSNMDIGRYSTNNEFDGYMCNFGVWSSHLSQAQVKSIMNKNYDSLSASEKTNLVSWWNLDETLGDKGIVLDKDGAIGENLLANADFANGQDDWGGFGSGRLTLLNGVVTMDGTSGTAQLSQSILTNGSTYEVEFTITDHNGDTTNSEIIDNGGNSLFAIPGDGTYKIHFTLAYANANMVFRAKDGSVFSISNISVKLVNGNHGTLS